MIYRQRGVVELLAKTQLDEAASLEMEVLEALLQAILVMKTIAHVSLVQYLEFGWNGIHIAVVCLTLVMDVLG